MKEKLQELVDGFNERSRVLKLVIREPKNDWEGFKVCYAIPSADEYMEEGCRTGDSVYLHASKKADQLILKLAEELNLNLTWNNSGTVFWLTANETILNNLYAPTIP